ncbi:MAG: hypothetical protein KF723_22470 [Rhizobiaceae bacterium]|nr:hypothetical protein [Rhizobiaceae bacterium]
MRVILAAALVAASALPASAQMACGKREMIVAALASQHNETRIAFALSQKGVVIEVFVSEVGTWTLVASGPGGMSCLLDSGTNWEGPKPVKEEGT